MVAWGVRSRGGNICRGLYHPYGEGHKISAVAVQGSAGILWYVMTSSIFSSVVTGLGRKKSDVNCGRIFLG